MAQNTINENKNYFVIIGTDGKDGQELRKIHRSAHVEYWVHYDKLGQIKLGGPLTDKAGSLLVIEADSQDDAERIAKNDPYMVHGIFTKVVIHPFTQVFPQLYS